MISVSIVADSVNEDGVRLTTFELTYPRFIHSEVMTHRIFSRNSSSSRAIPAKVMIDKVKHAPFVPMYWGANKAGMQAGEELSKEAISKCTWTWLSAAEQAVKHAEALTEQGLHKQIVNRLLEPFSLITVILTSTSFTNFFKLRCSTMAEPHLQHLAELMRKHFEASRPRCIEPNCWHLPYVDGSESDDMNDLIKKSVARCARGSYLQASGDFTLNEDMALYERLANSGHWSPFEHQAVARYDTLREPSNFHHSWTQLRRIVDKDRVQQ